MFMLMHRNAQRQAMPCWYNDGCMGQPSFNSSKRNDVTQVRLIRFHISVRETALALVEYGRMKIELQLRSYTFSMLVTRTYKIRSIFG